jgi:hypothetical protein
MNYQQYDWFFDASKAPAKTTSSVTGDPWAVPDIGACIGDTCCSDGLIYDTTINQCVVPGTSTSSSGTSTSTSGTSTSTGASGSGSASGLAALNIYNVPTTESMVTGILTKTQPGKIKADYDLRQLTPFNA